MFSTSEGFKVSVQLSSCDFKFLEKCLNFQEIKNKPAHDKTYKMTCVPSEDSDQPGHLPRLIRVDAQADQSPCCVLYG